MNWNKNKEIILTILIVAITILSWLSFYDYKSKKFKIKLGLDLRSGSHLTLRLKPVIDPATKKLREINYQIVKQTIEILERRINPHGTMELIMQPEGLDRIIIEIPEMTNLKEVEDLISQTAHLEFKEQFYNPATKQLDYRTVLDGTALSSADVGFDSANNPTVSFTLNKEGAKEFAKITERNVGKPLAIFFDEKLIDSPNVKEPITGGRGQISGGGMTLEACNNLSVLLNAGALPLPIEILESMTISPTLGQESLNKSLLAGFIGLALVMIFMVWYYHLPGLVANLALIIYSMVLLAIMSLWGFVLTLPGIAGFILSIGMAVDANILIFERLKEELKAKKTIRTSLEIGFKRAFSSILDSHVTTFLGALVLYYYGSSSIKGFGLTLMLGTALSLITAVFVTRVFLELIVNNNLAIDRKSYGG